MFLSPSSYLPEEQSERSGASWSTASCLRVGGGHGCGDGAARRGGQQELSGDGTGGVTRLNRDQRDGAVVIHTCRYSHTNKQKTKHTCEANEAACMFLSVSVECSVLIGLGPIFYSSVQSGASVWSK